MRWQRRLLKEQTEIIMQLRREAVVAQSSLIWLSQALTDYREDKIIWQSMALNTADFFEARRKHLMGEE